MEKKEVFCLSCGIPLSMHEAKCNSEEHCKYCTNENGELLSWEVLVERIAKHFYTWQKMSHEESRRRAIRYLTSMPAWAHKFEDKKT